MDIQPTTQTITTYAVTLTDEEVAEILVDPSGFQKQLRAIRAAQANGKHGSKNIILPKRRAKNGGGDGPLGKLACPECAKTFTNPGWLAAHREKVHGVARDAA